MLDTAPFVCHGDYVDGCLTRLSTAALLNVTAGGGSTVPTFVVERALISIRKGVPAMKPPSLTIGIEEEYQIIDPETRELTLVHHADPGGRTSASSEQVKPELHQSMVEVGTKVCRTPGRGAGRAGPAARRGHRAGRRGTGSRSPPPARIRSRPG